MQSFFLEISKLTFTAIIILVLGFVFFSFIDDEEAYYLPDAEYVQAWLNEIVNTEEKGFKAETLKETCGSEHIADKGWCTGYMLGFAEGHQVSREPIFCLDGQFSSDQLGQSFKNFMEANPQHWGKSRSVVLTGALQKSFPCDLFILNQHR